MRYASLQLQSILHAEWLVVLRKRVTSVISAFTSISTFTDAHILTYIQTWLAWLLACLLARLPAYLTACLPAYT